MTRPDPSELAAVGAPILYAPDEAAGILDPSGKTTGYWLLKRARSGEFPCTRVGRSIVFSPGNLAEIARSLHKSARPKNAAVPPQRSRRGTSKPPATATTSRSRRGAA